MKIGIIGYGNLGKALVRGLILTGFSQSDIEINARKRYVSVTDNAAGIPCAQFVKIMSSIADITVTGLLKIVLFFIAISFLGRHIYDV